MDPAIPFLIIVLAALWLGRAQSLSETRKNYGPPRMIQVIPHTAEPPKTRGDYK